MILFPADRPALAREYWGKNSMLIKLRSSQREREVRVSVNLRAMLNALAAEMDYRLNIDIMITELLRTWAEQDGFYPDKAELPLDAKTISTHMTGTAGDLIPIARELEPSPEFIGRCYDAMESFLNSVFPYTWNNKNRKPPRGKKTAYVHEHFVRGKSCGKHLHCQLSW